MTIFLAIAIELATIIGTIAIKINGTINSLLEISKNGYKIDKEALANFKMTQKKEQNENNKIPSLGLVLMLIPGLNLLLAEISNIIQEKNIMNDPQIKDNIIPMTEEEKEQYKKMETRYQKLIFTAVTVGKKDNEDFFGFVGKRPIMVENEVTALNCDKLIPLSYTFDEVKKLNEVTTNSYRVGKIDGRNIAIIGIPNPDYKINKIKFNLENGNSTYVFNAYTDEEAKDKRFLVYPFTNEKIDELEKYIKKIKEFRNYNMNNSVDTKSHLGESMIDYFNQEHGPTLKKTLFNKNRF